MRLLLLCLFAAGCSAQGGPCTLTETDEGVRYEDCHVQAARHVVEAKATDRRANRRADRLIQRLEALPTPPR